jgi:hypothetical protein
MTDDIVLSSSIGVLVIASQLQDFPMSRRTQVEARVQQLAEFLSDIP